MFSEPISFRSLPSCQMAVFSRHRTIPVNDSTLMRRGAGACCFPQDEQSNPSRELKVMGHFLNENVDQIERVVLVTGLYLVGELCLLLSNVPSVFTGVPWGGGFSRAFPDQWQPQLSLSPRMSPSGVLLRPPAFHCASQCCGFLWLQP